MKLSTSLQENVTQLNDLFAIEKSFDFIHRNLYLGETPAYWLGINGFCKSEIMLKIFSDLQNFQFTKDQQIQNLTRYMEAKIGYVQAEQVDDFEPIIKNVLSGASVLLVEGFSIAVILDSRSYPARGIEEPDTEKVSIGSRDGFVETLVFNTALIRRRIRNPKLTFEILTVGSDSKTDVTIGYVGGHVNSTLLDQLRDKISSLDISALTMGAKSLEELLIPKKWYHPLPQVRYTQRPDVACSYLLEGYLVVLVDNSPTAMIFPCNIFQFTQHPDDYYLNPAVGSYFRFMRFGCMLLALLLMPTFLLLGMHNELLPPDWQFLSTESLTPTRLLVHILVIELGLNLFQYSSALAPNMYSGPLGLIGGLLIGQIAVDLKWLSIEALFYGAATLFATLSLSSKELIDALRLYRLFLILATGFFDFYGFIIGLLLVFLSAATTKTFGGNSYLWPLFPFDACALKSLLFRCSARRETNKK